MYDFCSTCKIGKACARAFETGMPNCAHKNVVNSTSNNDPTADKTQICPSCKSKAVFYWVNANQFECHACEHLWTGKHE